MKSLRYLKLTLLFCVVFVAGVWLFAPLERLGACVVSEIKLAAAKNGVFITFSGMESSGMLTPSFVFTDFGAEAPVVMMNLSSCTIKLLPLSSLMAGGISCSVSFGQGEITLFPKNKLEVQGGSFQFTGRGSDLKIANCAVEGDIKITGQLAYDRKKAGITDNSLLFKVPANIGTVLASPLLEKYVESVSPGEWRIRQDASARP